MTFKTEVIFTIESTKRLTEEDKSMLVEYAQETVANSVESSKVVGVTTRFGKSVEVKK